MPVKIVEVPDLGTVRLYKRRDARTIKITIDRSSRIRVTLPSWAPYRVGLQFALSRKAWINEHLTLPGLTTEGVKVGKAHHVMFVTSHRAKSPSTRLSNQTVQVTLPAGTDYSDPRAQAAAKRGIDRALRQEATQLLPIRLKQLAQKHGFVYESVEIKLLRSRWGSCSHKKDIALNLYLMQLPWELIDYVLLHELTHTKVLNHSKEFWDEMLRCDPNAKKQRALLRSFQPHI